MSAADIVDAVRTPIAKGKASGAYAGILHAHALRALLERTAIDPLAIDDSPVPDRSAVGTVRERAGRRGRLGG